MHVMGNKDNIFHLTQIIFSVNLLNRFHSVQGEARRLISEKQGGQIRES